MGRPLPDLAWIATKPTPLKSHRLLFAHPLSSAGLPMALLLVETLCNDHNILCTLFFLRQYKQQLNFLLNNEVILYIPLKSTQTFHCKTSFLIFSTSYDTSHILIFILIEVSVDPLQCEFSTWMWRIIFHHIIQVIFIENDRLLLQLSQNGTTDTWI